MHFLSKKVQYNTAVCPSVGAHRAHLYIASVVAGMMYLVCVYITVCHHCGHSEESSMRRFEWCINDPTWQLFKVSKFEYKPLTFFSNEGPWISRSLSLFRVAIHQSKQVQDFVKRTDHWNFLKWLTGTWKSSMWIRYFFVLVLIIKYPFFSMMMLCPWWYNPFVLIYTP